MTLSIRTLLLSPWPYHTIRMLLGAIFIWAGGAKLINPRAFARTLSGWGLVPDELLVAVAIALPALELVAGVALVFDIRGGLKLVSGLLLMFLSVLGFGLIKGLDVDCGCFSADELQARTHLRSAVFRDLSLIGMVGYLFIWRWFQKRSGMEAIVHRKDTETAKTSPGSECRSGWRNKISWSD